ncbi:hypothetical protein ACIBEA_04590 [Streptomyces sp. NPDC051555]|uniref:hypothetical protein n=1 Tax=Streptomyces sp. NPDC051555 TaxID=3365657 RepID=UPI0037B0C658
MHILPWMNSSRAPSMNSTAGNTPFPVPRSYYAATSGAVRDMVPGLDHTQPGDPVKGAAAVLVLADADVPPLRAQSGSDCVAELDRKIAGLRAESAAWRHLALSTDRDDARALARGESTKR